MEELDLENSSPIIRAELLKTDIRMALGGLDGHNLWQDLEARPRSIINNLPNGKNAEKVLKVLGVKHLQWI